MKRIFPVFLSAIFLVSPLLLSAQTTPSPLVPCDGAAGVGRDGKTPLTECQVCHAVQLGQNIINFLVGIAAFVAVIIFAYAGFMMLTSAGDTGKVSQARGTFTNVVIGIVIVLAGWLLIDTLMKWVFQGRTDTEKGSPLYEDMKDKFGPWNKIVCVTPVVYRPPDPAGAGAAPVLPPGGVPGNGKQCPPGSGCTVADLIVAGYTDEKQANAMSCIAMLESTGNPTATNPPGCTSLLNCACGTFQILNSHWAKAQNHGPGCSPSTSCTNTACNVQTARILSQRRVANGEAPYGDWTCPGCNNRVQNECVNRYDPKPYPR